MIPCDAVADMLRLLRRDAKFIAVKHSSEFTDEAAQLGDGYYFADLYDEAINANLIKGDFGYVLVQNTYIASFAYNLFFCVLYCHRNGKKEDLDRLLLHNLKKLCAEQLYRERNVVSSRALLLETLLYEERVMIPVFRTQETDPSLAELAWSGAMDLMLLSLNQHELGHYYAHTQPHIFEARVRSGPAPVEHILSRVRRDYGAAFAGEFECDVFGIYNCLQQNEDRFGLVLALRGLCFGYAAYASIYSLAATAEATAALWVGDVEEQVNLTDLSPFPPDEVLVSFIEDKPFVDRARLVLEVCGLLAQERGMNLFGEDGPFPLAPSVIDDLLRLCLRVFDCEDVQARNLSRLVARAFQGHEEGMEYLYLRSKRFRSNRTGPLNL